MNRFKINPETRRVDLTDYFKRTQPDNDSRELVRMSMADPLVLRMRSAFDAANPSELSFEKGANRHKPAEVSLELFLYIALEEDIPAVVQSIREQGVRKVTATRSVDEAPSVEILNDPAKVNIATKLADHPTEPGLEINSETLAAATLVYNEAMLVPLPADDDDDDDDDDDAENVNEEEDKDDEEDDDKEEAAERSTVNEEETFSSLQLRLAIQRGTQAHPDEREAWRSAGLAGLGDDEEDKEDKKDKEDKLEGIDLTQVDQELASSIRGLIKWDRNLFKISRSK